MEPFSLTDKEKKALLLTARNALNNFFGHRNAPLEQQTTTSDVLNCKCGVFVSLYNNSQLRGCLGRFNSNIPLLDLVHEMAISTAINDSRFPPITKSEVANLNIEISVLTPMKKISSINEIELGRHGIYIKKGDLSGTFLPQVALKTNWNLEGFLGHCSRDKAGIGWDGWRNADIFTYEAIVFQELDFF